MSSSEAQSFQLIFLIGMPCSGKSFWAEAIHQATGIPYLDLDKNIEEIYNLSIAEIFDIYGENEFRNIESNALKSIGSNEYLIVATGGGTACFNNNMEWMMANGICIWLDEDLSIIAKRLLLKKVQLPLWKNIKDNEIQIQLTDLYQKRKTYYQRANYTLTEKEININTFISIINNETTNKHQQ